MNKSAGSGDKMEINKSQTKIPPVDVSLTQRKASNEDANDATGGYWVHQVSTAAWKL